MNWKRVSPVCLLSDCGQYTVTRSGPPERRVYQAFHLKQSLLVADNAEACKQACEVAANA